MQVDIGADHLKNISLDNCKRLKAVEIETENLERISVLGCQSLVLENLLEKYLLGK